MIVYHGSNVKIEKIDLNKCRKYKDFGQGFYCKTIKQQAKFFCKLLQFFVKHGNIMSEISIRNHSTLKMNNKGDY